MTEERANFKNYLRALVQETPQEREVHPRPESLVAYYEGGLPAADEEQIRDHLADCRECVALLIDLSAFPKLTAGAAEMLSDAQVGQAWERIKGLVRTEEESRVARLSRWPSVFGSILSRPLPFALATSLAIICFALAAWLMAVRQENRRLAQQMQEWSTGRDRDILSTTESLKDAQRRLEDMARRSDQLETEIADLHQSIDQLSQPQANVAIIDLYPRGFIRGQPSESAIIELPSDSSLITLVLNVADRPGYQRYQVEILDRAGRMIWRAERLRRSPLNNFTVALPTRTFPAGQYRIRLFGLRAAGRDLIEDYSLSFKYQ